MVAIQIDTRVDATSKPAFEHISLNKNSHERATPY